MPSDLSSRGLISEPVGLIGEKERLGRAVLVAEGLNLSKLIVIREGRFYGLLDMEALAGRFVSPSARVEEFAMRAVGLAVLPDSDPLEALLLAFRHNLPIVPVVSRGTKVIGVVKRGDLIRELVKYRQEVIDNTRIGDVATKGLVSLSPNDSVMRARYLMAVNAISSLPVIGDRLRGAVRLTRLLARLYEGSERSGLLGPSGVEKLSASELTEEVFVVEDKESLGELIASEDFLKFGRAFLVSGNGNVTGVITEGDVLKLLAKRLGLADLPIILSLPNLPPEVSSAARELLISHLERLRRLLRPMSVTVSVGEDESYMVRIKVDGSAIEESVKSEEFVSDPLRALRSALERLEKRLKKLKELKTEETTEAKD
ncbi:MAG: CBS domain-containing protein [Sulfolobales archaeon]|nr:CBS domain-containing protein [Sulfolobales archaeon]